MNRAQKRAAARATRREQKRTSQQRQKLIKRVLASRKAVDDKAVRDIVTIAWMGVELLSKGQLGDYHMTALFELLAGGCYILEEVSREAPESEHEHMRGLMAKLQLGIESLSDACERPSRVARGSELQAIREATDIADKQVQQAPEGVVLRSFFAAGALLRQPTR